jgi:hypothetical protein
MKQLKQHIKNGGIMNNVVRAIRPGLLSLALLFSLSVGFADAAEMRIVQILSAADVYEKVQSTFAQPIGVYYYERKGGILESDNSGDNPNRPRLAVFTCKSQYLNPQTISKVRFSFDLVQVPTYPLLWLRIHVMDGSSPKYRTKENPDGSDACEWVIDVAWKDHQRDLTTLTTVPDALVLAGDEKQGIAYQVDNFLNLSANQKKIAQARELLRTKYKGATENDRRKAVLYLKNNYPISGNLDD